MTLIRFALVALMIGAGVRPGLSQELPPDARSSLEQAVTAGTEAARVLALYPPADPIARPTTAAELQAALDDGPLHIELPPNAILTGAPNLVIRRSGTTLIGNGASFAATNANTPAIYSGPDVDDLYLSNLTITSPFGGAAVQCGDNLASTQSDLARVPARITYVGLTVPTHRGRRAFEVNCTAVRMLHTHVDDTFSTAGADSQAIAILNTPGDVLIDGGVLSAGSEIILTGGDTMKLLDANGQRVQMRGITVRNLLLYRPLSWRTDANSGLRVVKNSLELKDATEVLIQNVDVNGSWVPTQNNGQGGEAFTFTPRNGGQIEATLENVRVWNVSSCFSVTGFDSSTNALPTPQRTRVTVRNLTCQTNKAALGGRGIFALLQDGVGLFDVTDSVAVLEGPQIFYVGDSDKAGTLRMTNSLATAGAYSFGSTVGNNGTNWSTYAEMLDVQGNTFTGEASALRTNFPSNTFVDRVTFDAAVEPRLQ